MDTRALPLSPSPPDPCGAILDAFRTDLAAARTTVAAEVVWSAHRPDLARLPRAMYALAWLAFYDRRRALTPPAKATRNPSVYAPLGASAYAQHPSRGTVGL